HVPVHPVEAGQQAGRARAVLGGQDKRARAGHDAELHQLGRDAGRRIARGDLERDRTGAGAGVVGRVVLVHVEAVDVNAAHRQGDHDAQQGDRRGVPGDPAPAAAAAPAVVVVAPSPAGPARTAAGPAAVLLLVALVAEAGDEPVTGAGVLVIVLVSAARTA